MPRLRPFVKFDKDNQVVPGSLVFSQKIPKPGKWREISLEGCCDTSTLQNNPPNKLSTQVVCTQVTLTPIINRDALLPVATFYKCTQDENGNNIIGEKYERSLDRPLTVCVAHYASGSLYPYFSSGQGTVLEQGDCYIAVPGCGKLCEACGVLEIRCPGAPGQQPVPNCVQTVITADQGVDFTVMFLGCGNDEYTTITVPAGQTSTDVIGVICRNFRLGDVIVVSGDGSIEDFNTCTSTFNPWFNETIFWGEDAPTACGENIPIIVTGNGTTFCNSTTFTSPSFSTIGTGGIFISYAGDIKTVNVTLGSDIATFNGGCDPC
jgi:hypothetical protein